MNQKVTPIREPQQARAKIRYDAILAATKALILEKGSAQLKVQEIAKKAECTTGAIYRYFPSKHAIIQTLLDDYFQTVEHIMPTQLVEINSLDELVSTLLDGYEVALALYEQEPVMRDILISGAADKLIQAYDLADSRKRAKAIYISARHLFPRENWTALEDYLFFLMHLVTPTIHMILSLESDERERLLATSKLWSDKTMFERFL